MRHICAWCKCELGDPVPPDDGQISHGICEECRKKLKAGAFNDVDFIQPDPDGLAKP